MPRTARAPRTSVADELLEGLAHAAAVARGEAEPSRVHLAQGMPDVRAIRARTGLTREAFAERFGLKLTAVRDWEQGRRTPEPAAVTLLKVIAAEPDAVVRALQTRAAA